MIQGRVLILGGAGFLGRGIMRHALVGNWPAKFTIYSRDELKQQICKRRYPDANYVLGDIRDIDRLALIMTGHDVVIHAAALKYIPEAEFNVSECVETNIFGTANVVKAAAIAGVGKVCFISTDKAVLPINTYGLTKAVGERIVCESSWQRSGTVYVSCRYGNVIGSTGSVVPVFKQQLEDYGYVRITDPDMTRFWLTIDEAVNLIELALTQPSGTILVPDPKSMKIGDIAKLIANDSVKIVGLRPGEKMHETLLTEAESAKVKIDHLYGAEHYIYFPLLREALRGEEQLFSLESDKADLITPEEFAACLEDAELV